MLVNDSPYLECLNEKKHDGESHSQPPIVYALSRVQVPFIFSALFVRASGEGKADNPAMQLSPRLDVLGEDGDK